MPRRNEAEEAFRATIGELATRTQKDTLAGGREVVQQSSPLWRRVTDGAPCGWCAMLASRGPVYGSAAKAGQGRRYHGHCGCTAEPFDGSWDDWEPTPEEQHYETAYVAVHEPGMTGERTAALMDEWMKANPYRAAAEAVEPRWRRTGLPYEVTPKFGRVSAKHRQTITDALDVIGKVHGSAKPQEVFFKSMRDTGNGTHGVYTPIGVGEARGTGGVVELLTAEKMRHPLVTTIHELGHYFDFRQIPGAMFSSKRSTSAAWVDFRKAARETPEWKVMQSAAADPEVSRKAKAWVAYASDDEELWARAYAQWIAVRSGDQRMLAELAEMVSDPEMQGSHRLLAAAQWSDESFGPIAEAIDEIMQEFK